MDRFVALFRGINVGGRNILPMKELTSLLENNSCHGVQTYIQSGNAVFESEEPPENIGRLIERQYGFRPEILILGKMEFLDMVSNNPFTSSMGKQVHIFFCQNTPNVNEEKLAGLKSETEKYVIRGKAAYLYAPDGIGRSKLAANMEKCLGVPATGRNLNTVNKLVEMLQNT